MHPILFKIGPLTIYTYGFFVSFGVVCGYLVSSLRAKEVGIDSRKFSDILFSVVVFGFLGAKLLYILIEWRYFLSNPLAVIRSGFVFYGGVIAGIVTLYFLAKRYQLDFLELADLVVVGVPLGHALGRVGCFFYGCCYGIPTSHWYGVLFPDSSPAGLSGLAVIPTQLISAVSLVLIFIILRFLSSNKKFPGQIFTSYIFIYGIFRFFIEFLRGDPRGQISFLSTAQFIAIFAASISGFWLYRRRRAS